MSEETPRDGAAHKRTPVGLLGLSQSDVSGVEFLPLNAPPPPGRWRFAKYLMAVVLPVGIAFAAHRLSEPEGLDAAESLVSVSAPALATNDGALGTAAARLPSRAFEPGAFGHSDAVRVRVVLPNERVALPITFVGATDDLAMQWIGFDGKGNAPVAPWPRDNALRAPSRAGAFWLVLSRGAVADTIADFALLVEHPMPNARATGINGYHLGRWPRSSDGIVPRGFIEVTERTSDFPLSPHLRMSDFVVHDQQDAYPKYLHVREPLLDKIELVVNEVAQMRGRSPSSVRLNVASGFRSPSHNGVLSGSAQDSRHMYGDAADIAIDANNDGRLTEIDARLVAAAAEAVERKHPDLVGGIGLYITPDGAGWPYVHVDVRGHRARWRGGARRGAAVDSLPANATFDSVAAAVSASAAPAPAVPFTPPTRKPAAAVRTVEPPVVTPKPAVPADPFSRASQTFRAARP
ncbi:MAG TPA: D-Ala-D-Ala carboxypeptidase family metallohydrolase [Gemmatimonadaceae bacterium]|nr:D-Ala-D-Ala carboxypeptidase family metallohydrolase [Gemmatimonadaceae bacterium]